MPRFARSALLLCLLLLQPALALAAGTFSATGSLASGRSHHTATLLPNGQVLVVGGYNDSGNLLASAELYDPASGTWTATGSLAAVRSQHTATLLPNGQVLVAGGVGSGYVASAELYDPASGMWTATGSLVTVRSDHTATLLPNGQVLIAGGLKGGFLANAELYDPASGMWTATGSLAKGRYFHTMTLLPNGQVLVAAGYNSGPLASAELYDPASGMWTASGSLTTARYYPAAALLPNGQVLIVGGINASDLSSAELYDPASGMWTATGSLTTGRTQHTLTLLSNGQALAAAGFANGSPLTSAELYDPVSGKWSASGHLATARFVPTATLLPDGRVLVVAGDDVNNFTLASAELYTPAPPPLDPPIYDTTVTTAEGAAFLAFGSPTVDSGIVGGAATVKTGSGPKRTVIYGGATGDELATTGGPDGGGATFTLLGDPVFAGEALGFAATVELAPAATLPLRRMEFDVRAFGVKPGGRLAALYSQLSKAAGIHRLAGQGGAAPGGGQYAKLGSFGLPRQRLGLLYAALLHHDGQGVRPDNDYGIWRERSDATGTDLLLRTGQHGFSRDSQRGLAKVIFMPPVSNATDQRLSHAPDGGLAVTAKFDDGTSGVVVVAADGTQSVPLDTASAVPDEAGTADGNVEFVKFLPPATASGKQLALLAALKAAKAGLPPPPAQAVFANLGGTMQRVLARGELVPGLNGLRFGQLGQPLLGEKGMIGLIAALTGKGVTPASNQVLVRIEGGVKTVVARLGAAVPDYAAGVVFKRFMSVVVTDSDPARMVFTALVAGPGVNGSNNVGLWSYSAAQGTKLVLRSGGSIKASGQTLTVRTFEALVAPKKSQGQGRSTDASGFVTAKAKLSDGRVGVLRIPLP